MADSLIDEPVLDQTGEKEVLRTKWITKFPNAPPELIDSKVESDLMIKMQNARFDDIRADYLKLREETTAKASLEELISRQEKLLANPDTTPPTQKDPVIQPSFKPEDIDSLLEQKLSAREQKTKFTENFNFVKAKLKEQFGDNASTILKQRMDTLGLDQSFTDELAQKHPQVFLRTFGLEEQVQKNNFQAPPRSEVRQNRFAPVTPKRDWNYYQELKKNDPRMYLDPKIAVQMHNDAIELGDAFNMPTD